MTTIAVALFFVATVWTGARARNATETILPLGLGFVCLASAMRVPAVVPLVVEHLPTPSHEVVKHMALVSGCVLVGLWARSTLVRSSPPLGLVLALLAALLAVMGGVVAANGPWTTEDLDLQTRGRPAMWLYWTVYYGAFAAGTTLFATAAWTSRSTRALRQRWGMDAAAVGAVVGIAWAVVSLLTLLTRDPVTGLHPLDDIQRRYLIPVSSALATIGLVGQLLTAAVQARRSRRDLEALHRFLVAAVGDEEPRPPGAPVSAYHREIEILDAVATLSHHSAPDDADHVRRTLPGLSREGVVVHQMHIAAARQARGEPPRAHTADWSPWLADEDALRRLGRAFRDHCAESEVAAFSPASEGATQVAASQDGPTGCGPRWARLVSEVCAPGYTVAVTVLVIALRTIELPAGWWQVAALWLLAAGLPYVFVHGLARLGVWESRHVRPRRQRMVV
jgi:hypothetical protein